MLSNHRSCLGGAVVGRRTPDQKAANLTPGRVTVKSTRSTQLGLGGERSPVLGGR